MPVINQTRGEVLATDITLAKGLILQLKGAIGKKEFKEGEAIVFPLCNSIHTLFLKFPVDAVFLDSNGIVVGAVRNLKPWKSSSIYLAARIAIELPSGTLDETKTRIGDKIVIS